MDQGIKEVLDLVSERLASTAKSDMVVGKPLELGGLTVVPLSRVSVGMGGGGGQGEGQGMGPGGPGRRGHNFQGVGKGVGGGCGGGAKVRPAAVAVFTPNGVKILPIPDRKGKLDKLLDRLPDLVERVQAAVDKE